MLSIIREISESEVTRPEEHPVKTLLPFRPYLHLSYASGFLSVFIIVLATVFTTSCGTSGTSGPPPLSGNTSVTILLSSTANDQISQFNVGFNSITLTGKSGKLFSVGGSSLYGEFIHLNGSTEPLITVTMPQDVYTSATADIGPANFTCETLIPSTGGLVIDTYAYGYVPADQVTVNLPVPITITGTAMALSLNMDVSKSASFPGSCYVDGIPTYSINPTFNLTGVPLSPQIEEPLLDGEISSVNSANNSFTVVLEDGQPLSINTNDSTVYQGINGFSLLTTGAFVDMDAVIQSDGSQLATRVAVEDTDDTDLTESVGPLLQVNAAEPVLTAFERQQQGYLTASGQGSIWNYYNFGGASFQISGRFKNLQNLPFVASFDGANMFDGQDVYITTHALQSLGGPNYTPATTVTLMPQTLNGTINGTSSDGGFTTYDVTLASYNLIPTLAVQQGQTTILTNPSDVVVYVDSNTKLLNSQPLAVGSVVRWTGMLFNDSGTLRMDCGQVNDGVAIQPGTQVAETAGSAHQTQHSVAVHRYLQHPNTSK
jgi:Domain of unknown function (DUF5666)